MKKRFIVILILSLLMTTASGCGAERNTEDEYDDGYSDLRDKYYYDLYAMGCTRQAWKLNIEDGSILVACPDPLCSHGAENSACPFHMTIPLQFADGGRYFFYIGWTNGENAIYCFDTETNETSKIYDYDKLPSANPALMYGEGRLFFDIPEIKTEDGDYIETTARTLLYYDVKTKQIKEYGKKDESQRLLFEYHGKLYYRNESGIPYATTGSFDDSEPVPLPEGAEINALNGYNTCGPGFIAKQSAPGNFYLYEENRSLPVPNELSDKAVIGLSAGKDSFYFLTDHPEPANGEDGHYIEKICILNKDGTYKIFSVQSDFSFYVLKGCGDRVVCEISNEYKDGKDLSPWNTETPNSLIWIDLQSGKASLYDALHAENVTDMYLGDITVKTERIK